MVIITDEDEAFGAFFFFYNSYITYQFPARPTSEEALKLGYSPVWGIWWRYLATLHDFKSASDRERMTHTPRDEFLYITNRLKFVFMSNHWSRFILITNMSCKEKEFVLILFLAAVLNSPFTIYLQYNPQIYTEVCTSSKKKKEKETIPFCLWLFWSSFFFF